MEVLNELVEEDHGNRSADYCCYSARVHSGCLYLHTRVSVQGEGTRLRSLVLFEGGVPHGLWSQVLSLVSYPVSFLGAWGPSCPGEGGETPPHFLSGQNMPLAVMQDFVV